MAIVQVKVDGKVVFEKTVDEVMLEAWEKFPELKDVDPKKTTLDVIPE
jgi:hypothetical protein